MSSLAHVCNMDYGYFCVDLKLDNNSKIAIKDGFSYRVYNETQRQQDTLPPMDLIREWDTRSQDGYKCEALLFVDKDLPYSLKVECDEIRMGQIRLEWMTNITGKWPISCFGERHEDFTYVPQTKYLQKNDYHYIYSFMAFAPRCVIVEKMKVMSLEN
jgi:hypothetical protein